MHAGWRLLVPLALVGIFAGAFSAASARAAVVEPRAVESGSLIVTAKTAEIREGPSHRSEAITVVEKGEILVKQGRTGGWYYVRLGEDSFGWISGRAVRRYRAPEQPAPDSGTSYDRYDPYYPGLPYSYPYYWGPSLSWDWYWYDYEPYRYRDYYFRDEHRDRDRHRNETWRDDRHRDDGQSTHNTRTWDDDRRRDSDRFRGDDSRRRGDSGRRSGSGHVPLPPFRRIDTLWPPDVATARSRSPSPSKSEAHTE
jgi:hypothetical protein